MCVNKLLLLPEIDIKSKLVHIPTLIEPCYKLPVHISDIRTVIQQSSMTFDSAFLDNLLKISYSLT